MGEVSVKPLVAAGAATAAAVGCRRGRGRRIGRGRGIGGILRRGGIDGLAVARDPDTQVVLLDFDFGQIGILEDVGEIADQRLIDTCLFISHFFNAPILVLG